MGDMTRPLDAVAGGLRNEDTEKKLRFIEELHSLGVSKYIDLPQLVVIGDQSSGKSSVLQAITRLPFPVSDKMCTRFATEVSLHRSSGPTSMVVSIKVGDEGSTAITRAHRQRMVEWNPRTLNIDELDAEAFAEGFSDILTEASDVILGDSKDAEFLSDATLDINVRGPQGINLTVVDIPGLVCVGHEAYGTSRSLVECYISNPKSIILAIAHPADPGTQEVFQILKNIPNKENRVIGAITKCDRKQEDAEDWILDTIKNERGRQNPYFLAQGWFGLRNRLPKEKDTTNDERDQAESLFFNQGVWRDLQRPTKLGINHLRKALTKMHNAHITDSIPELVPEIRRHLATCKTRLDKLGSVRDTKVAQLNCLVNLASDFHTMSTYALDGHYDKLPSGLTVVKVRKIVQETLEQFQRQMLKDFHAHFSSGDATFVLESNDEESWDEAILGVEIYDEIQRIVKENRGKESPGEVNPCVLDIMWKSKTAKWSETSADVVEKLVGSISRASGKIFESVCLDDDLRKNIQQWLSELTERVMKSARAELKRLLSDEGNGLIWSLNPRRIDLIQEMSNTRIKHMVRQLIPVLGIHRDSEEEKMKLEQDIKVWLGRRKDISAIFDTYDRLHSYYEIAMYRFIDNFGHQVVERHLLGPNSPLRIFQPAYVVRTLQEDDAQLQKLAGENENKVAERVVLMAEKASLEKALSTARNFGFCSS